MKKMQKISALLVFSVIILLSFGFTLKKEQAKSQQKEYRIQTGESMDILNHPVYYAGKCGNGEYKKEKEEKREKKEKKYKKEKKKKENCNKDKKKKGKKCGEGKCAEGKCGEGKCGKDSGKKMKKTKKESKCGEGKCGK